MKKNNIISDWLDEYGNPEIEKKVEMKLEDMNKERFNQIIDEVYNKYLTKYVGYDDVPPKELFLFEIKNNTEFSEKWGLKIEERELSLEERVSIFNSKMISEDIRTQIATVGVDETYWKSSLEKTKHIIPTKLITLEYNQEKIYIYE